MVSRRIHMCNPPRNLFLIFLSGAFAHISDMLPLRLVCDDAYLRVTCLIFKLDVYQFM